MPGATGRLHDIDNLLNRGIQIFKKVEEDDEFTLEKHSDHLINTLRYEYTLNREVKLLMMFCADTSYRKSFNHGPAYIGQARNDCGRVGACVLGAIYPVVVRVCIASVGPRVSGSNDPGEIACDIVCSLRCYLQICYLWVYDMRSGDAGDEAISGNYKCIDLSPVDSSSVYFFFLKL